MTPKVQTEAPKSGTEAMPDRRASNPVLTTAQRLEAIEAMRKRVNGHVDFMCGVAAMRGSSDEAKDAAVAAFHDRMAALERQLEKIAEGLRLG